MLRRRMPAATGEARRMPSSSGPRWTMASIMRRTMASPASRDSIPTTPQIPHIRVLLPATKFARRRSKRPPPPLRHRGEHAVANQARHRHGNGSIFGGGEYQTIVLHSQRHPETHRLGLVRSDHAAIGLIDTRGEQRAGKKREKFLGINARFSDQRERFRQAFDDSGNQKISRNLH